jgi:hypothetical protein
MSERETKQLVNALSELLADWLQAHPEKLPTGLRSAPSSGLLNGLGAEEQR